MRPIAHDAVILILALVVISGGIPIVTGANVYEALQGILTMFVIVGGVACGTYLYFRLRGKGCKSPLVVLGIAAPSFVSFFLGIVLGFRKFGNRYDLSPVEEVIFNIYMLGPLLVSILATTLVVAVLPRRTARRFGTRQVRFPWRGGGHALIGAEGLRQSSRALSKSSRPGKCVRSE